MAGNRGLLMDVLPRDVAMPLPSGHEVPPEVLGGTLWKALSGPEQSTSLSVEYSIEPH